MIIGTVVAGPWGNGLSGYSKGVDFNCNTSICYGITKPGEKAPGAVHQSFVNLQRAINRWSGKAKFTAIAVDGKIGAGTVSALGKAGKSVLETLPTGIRQAAQAVFESSLTKESAATNAVGLTDQLNTAADRLESGGQLPAPSAPPSSPPSNVPVGPTAQTPTSPPSSGGSTAPAPIRPSQPTVIDVGPGLLPQPQKSNTIWWILGAVAAVATAGVVTVVLVRRKKAGGRSAGRGMSMRPGRRGTSAYSTN